MPKLRAKKFKFKVDKHILTPKHSKLGEKDKAALLENYKISIRELPKILKTDSSIKDFDAKPGDIIRITRASVSAGEAYYFRVVTDV